MSKEYDNTNRGALFRNERKEKDNHPDHTGSINVDGVEYWLSAWVKTSKSGQKFFSLSVKQKDEKVSSNDVRREAAGTADPNDEIPFAPRESW